MMVFEYEMGYTMKQFILVKLKLALKYNFYRVTYRLNEEIVQAVEIYKLLFRAVQIYKPVV